MGFHEATKLDIQRMKLYIPCIDPYGRSLFLHRTETKNGFHTGATMKFKVVITYDAEYDGYVVDAPELVGCMSQGKTIDEALRNIKDAIKGWLEVEKKHNRLDLFEEREVFLGEVTV